MKTFFCLSLVFAVSAFAQSPSVEAPAYKWGDDLSFQILAAETQKPPFLRVFPGGKTKDKETVELLGTLKWGRGKSVLFPQEDAKAGLMVVFRTLALLPDATGKEYDAILEGEFNAVKVRVPRDQVESLLSGEPTALKLTSTTSKRILAITITVETDTEFLVRLEGERLYIDRITGGCTITRDNSLSGESDEYISAPVVQEKKKGDPQLYIGKPGPLAKLPIISE